MNVVEMRNGLQLDNDQPSNDQINALARYLSAAIPHVDGALLIEGEIPGFQFDAHGLPIDRLDETRTEFSVDGNGSSDRL